MKYSIKQRIWAIVLTLAMILPMIPVMSSHVHAAGALTGLSVNGLGASYTDASSTRGSASWSASGTTITGTATGYKQIINLSINTTLTLTNNLQTEATLKFNYALTGGGSVSGVSNNAYEGKLGAGKSITITLTSPKGASTNTLTITGLSLISTSAGDVTTTFMPAAVGGSYTVDKTPITGRTDKTAAAGTSYALVATPATNYQFFGWHDGNVYISYDASTSITPSENQTITPVFVNATAALFGVGSAKFTDLGEADTYAKTNPVRTIVLLNNGTITGDYTISAGNTLLIPYDDAKTVHVEADHLDLVGGIFGIGGEPSAWVKPSAYCTLTMAAGSSITVNGAINVGGVHSPGNGSGMLTAGSPSGKVGMIQMVSGSEIIVNANANLYCWGYIYGGGTVTAKNGATVHENFQFTDFRGGSATSSMATDFWVFPLSQYYVQNVEVATTFEYGAKEKVWTSIYMSKMIFSANVDFIGKGAMFTPAEGSSITKTYIPSKDRLQIDVNGTGAINSMALSLGGTSINSEAFVLPITNNMTININSGETTLNQSMALLPGVELTIAKGATLTLASGTPNEDAGIYTGAENLFVYDADEWTYGLDLSTETLDRVTGNFVHTGKRYSPLQYSPTRSYNRVAGDLKDVVVNILGTLNTEGFMYTTAGGASIISKNADGTPGNGRLIMNNGAGEDTLTVQANQSGTTYTYLAIPVMSAQLKNADGTYLDTTGAEPGAVFNYCSTHNKWYQGDVCADCAATPPTFTIIFKDQNGNTLLTIPDLESGAAVVFPMATPTKPYDTNNHYVFAGWRVEGDSEGTTYGPTESLPNATADVTYVAVFTPVAHSDTTGDKNHDCDVCGKSDVTGHNYGSATCDTPATCSECNATTGSAQGHIDENTDHKCDRNCGKIDMNMDKHVDSATDNDHMCDYGCGEVLEDCFDNDNHFCDVCGTELSDCYDGNNDHMCDICGDKLSDHVWEVYNYTNDGDTHTVHYICNTNPEHTMSESGQQHHYLDSHRCACGAREMMQYTVSYYVMNIHGGYVRTETETLYAPYGTLVTANPKPMGEGFTLNEGMSNLQLPVDEGTDLSVYYDRNQYQVKWMVNGNEHYARTYYYQETISAYEDEPFKEGHKFIGWDTVLPDTMPAKDITLNALFSVQSYWIYWYDANNELRELTEVKYGTPITPIDGPEKPAIDCTNFTFKGWKWNNSEALPDTMPADDIHAYPDYEESIVHEVGEGSEILPLGDGLHGYGCKCGGWVAKYEACSGGNATCTEQATCEVCGWHYGEVNGHSYDKKLDSVEVASPADCTKPATHYVKCDNCGETNYDMTIEVGEKKAHELDYIPGMSARCVEPGYRESWFCINCSTYFADAAAQHKIEDWEKWINDENGGYLPATGHNYVYTPNAEPIYTHTKKCLNGCGKVDPAEDCTFGNDHVCVCGKVETFTLTIYSFVPSGDRDPSGIFLEVSVPYGALLSDYIPENGGEEWDYAPIYRAGDTVRVNGSWYEGTFTITGWRDSGWNELDLATATMPAMNFTIQNNFTYTGWQYIYWDSAAGSWCDTPLGVVYQVDSYDQEGWQIIDGNAYYFAYDEQQHRYFRVEGVTRVPYPAGKINGITYRPDDRDLGKKDYPDTNSALFVFDENGKFLSDLNGLTSDNHWAVNGMLPWFVGLVEVDGDYYYFGADNTMVTTTHRTGGKIYLTRDSRTNVPENDIFVEGGIYFFGADGKLIKNDGITEMDGKLYYFDNYRLALGAGLVKENGNYYYVRSSGELVVNQSYWIYDVNEYTDIYVGTYSFDANGVMDVNSGKNGVYEEDGGLFYYENGLRTYKGLMAYEGGYIYVRSNGQLATGKYWITKTNDLNGFSEGTYTFDDEGMMILDGVVGGYYYENGKLAYKGLMAYEGGYIYVRSNGQLATGKYWVTKTNGLVAEGSYEFTADGMMVIEGEELPEIKNGVVEENGGLYYYVEGKITYAGLIEYDDGYIYVRSNGQLATGKYWITKTNGLLDEGSYTFGVDGKMITD